MATQEQIQQMLDMMKQQMTQIQSLQVENTTLRTNQGNNATPATTRPKTKAPDRPVVNANTDEREWELFKDSWNRYKTMTGITNLDLISSKYLIVDILLIFIQY